ncbi:MAG: ABC transporter permease, partial [Gemmatimonadaceae bacterium]
AMIFQELLQDIKWALRSLKRAPAFAFVVVLALGLGIGSNAAIFSIVNTYLFRPMAVKNADRLVVIAQTSQGSGVPGSVSYPNYLDVRTQTSVLSDVVLFQGAVVSARAEGQGDPERTFISLVSYNYFSTLGVKASLGSVISSAAALRKEPLIVLDARFWKRRFQSDAAIVGKTIRLNGAPFTVAGVADPKFTGTEELIVTDGYVPISTVGLINPGDELQFENRSWSSSRVLGVLAPGVKVGQARTALAVLATRIDKQYPAEAIGLGFAVEKETSARPDISVAHVMPWISAVFMALTMLVMIVACVNVTNLMLARGSARQGELVVRRALGATDLRMVRQLLTESVVLSLLGLVAGVLLATWITRWISNIKLAIDFPVQFNIGMDWRVFAFTAFVAIAAGLLTGLVPALRSGRGSLSEMLREGTRGGTASVSRRRLQSVLVVAQVAVSLVLLISAGLFVRSVRGAAHTDLGFKPSHLLLMSTELSPLHIDAAHKRLLYNQVLDGAIALPGVTSAALSRDVPMGGNNNSLTAYFDADLPTVNDRRLEIYDNTVSPQYFETMGLKVLKGREFTRDDRDSTAQVLIINAEMARRFWPNKDPLLQRFRVRKEGPLMQVVGVVTDTKYMFLNDAPRPYIYLPMLQRPVDFFTLHLRTSGEPTVVAASARKLFQNLNPDLAVYGVRSMETHLSNGLAFLFVRFGALVATTLGILGLIQAVVGLYGVISYGVSQRTREIGIRIALGASGGAVMRGVLRQGATLTAIGVVIGLVIAGASTRFMQSLLVGVSATDWMTFAAAAALLATVAVVSAWIPARRAARLQPIIALRSE